MRRGVNFRTEGGPQISQIATMFGLFCLGIVVLVAVFWNHPSTAPAVLIIGYASIAARDGEAPQFCRRLRPLQMPIGIVGPGALPILTVSA